MGNSGSRSDVQRPVARRKKRLSGAFKPSTEVQEKRRLKRLRSISDIPAPKHAKYVRQEELFWTGKKTLVPSLQKLERIDDHVIKAPKYLSRNPEQLVTHLTQICRTDLEKFRAIFRWVAENIDYDVIYLNTGRQQQNEVADVLRNGYAVCAGYVKLVSHLCSLADIDCRYIGGMSKSAEYMPGDQIDLEQDKGHAWIIVKIGGKEYLCDPTWAAGSTEGEARKKVFKKCWEEAWFLSDPAQFIESHWPTADTPMGKREDKRLDLQLLSTPVEDFNQWLRRPIKKGGGPYDIVVDLLTHQTGIVELRENEAIIKIRFNVCPLSVHAKLFPARTENELKGYAKVEQKGTIYIVYVRLPRGNVAYLLKINGSPLYSALDTERASNLVTYKLIGKGDKCHRPYPGEKDQYNVGLGRRFLDSGYTAKSITSPFMLVSQGKFTLSFGTPQNASSHDVTAKLVFAEQTDRNLKNEFCLDMVRNSLICNLNLQKRGEYLLTILTKIPERNKPDSFSYAANVIINCENPSSDKARYPERQFPYGPTREFYAFGFKLLSPKSAVLTAPTGTLEINMKRPDDQFFTFVLLREGNKYSKQHRCVMADVVGDIIHFRFRLPEKGMYQFYLTETEDGQATDWLYFALIDCQSPYQGELFPENSDCWGPTLAFRRMEFQTLRRKSSLVLAKRGKCRITMISPLERKRILYKVLDHSGKDVKENTCCDVSSKGDLLSFHFRFAQVGLYTFRLSCLNSRGEWDKWLAFYLIDCRAPWVGLLFPRLELPIGATSRMLEIGMRPSIDKYFYKTKTGRIAIEFVCENPTHTVHSLTKDDNKLNQYVYAETQTHGKGVVITYRINLPESGMYKLTGWENVRGSVKDELFRIVIECKQAANPCPLYFPERNTPNFSIGMDESAIERSGLKPLGFKSSTLRPDSSGIVSVTFETSRSVRSVWGWLVSTDAGHTVEQLKKYVYKQKGPGDCVTIKASPPEPGRFQLNIGAKVDQSGPNLLPCSYLIEAKKRMADGSGFPTAYATFVDTEGCALHRPIRNVLQIGRQYDFHVTVPGAENVAVSQIDLQKYRNNSYRGKVTIEDGARDVCVTAKFGKKITVLLKYDTVS